VDSIPSGSNYHKILMAILSGVSYWLVCYARMKSGTFDIYKDCRDIGQSRRVFETLVARRGDTKPSAEKRGSSISATLEIPSSPI
jgi:hypothetical protein